MTSLITLYELPTVTDKRNISWHVRAEMAKFESPCPDCKERDGPSNVGLLAIQPPDAAASPRIFY